MKKEQEDSFLEDFNLNWNQVHDLISEISGDEKLFKEDVDQEVEICWEKSKLVEDENTGISQRKSPSKRKNFSDENSRSYKTSVNYKILNSSVLTIDNKIEKKNLIEELSTRFKIC